MRLRRLRITRLPGIDQPFTVDGVGDGLVIVHGPNGIGKSSLCNAVRTLLWPDRRGAQPIIADAIFEDADGQWKVTAEGSHAQWWLEGRPAPAPELPPAHLNDCFFLQLRDLLEDSESAGLQLAKRVRRQMAGGFDLDAVRDERFAETIKKSRGNSQRARLDAAQRELRSAEQAQSALAEEERGLAGLRAEAEQARQASAQLDTIEKARVHATQREELARIEADLAGLSPALAEATGRELAQLDKREADIRRCADERRHHTRDLEESQRSARASGLDALIDAEALDRLRLEVEALQRCEAAVSTARVACDEAAAARAYCARRIGAPEAAIPELAREDSDALFDLLDEAQRTATREHEQTLRRDQPGDDPLSDAERTRLDQLVENIPHLRAWLRAADPAPSGADRSAGPKATLWIAAALAVAIGVGLAISVSPWLSALAGLGIGLAVGLVLQRAAGDAEAKPDAKRALQSQFDPALEAPSSWQASEVEALLRRMERERDELSLRGRGAERRAEERLAAEAQLATIAREQTALEERRRALAERLGLGALPSDARLVSLVRDTDSYLAARRDELAAAATLSHAQTERDAVLSKLGDALVQHGGAAPDDAIAARARVAELERRDQALRDARAKERSAAAAIRQSDAEARRMQAEHDEIYRALGVEVGDRPAIESLLADFDRHRELIARRRELATHCALHSEQLEKAGQQRLLALGAGELDVLQSECRASAEQLEPLRREIVRIESDVARARERHDLARAIRARDDVLDELGDTRDRLLEAAAGAFLLDSVREEHDTRQLPKVLARAGELFSLFTHHGYALKVAAGDDASFVARDMRAGEDRNPSQLSDGTRAQLMLAARLAFAEEAEGSAPLPIFLDEALDHSDPDRFEEIVRSLGRMVEQSGRQIVYFTNDPTDIARIQHALEREGCSEASTIDLAAVRKQAVSVANAAALRVPTAAPIAAPGNLSAEDYGVSIGARPLDPSAPVTAQHLFHLLWDALDALHRLLESRIDSVGQWQRLSQSGASLVRDIERRVGDGAAGRVDDRAQLLGEFCAARAAGRGRPVDRSVIEQSEAIGSKYLDPVAEIARELGGDADALIAALRTPSSTQKQRLKGMRREDNAAKLESHLLATGHLDPNPVLSEADVTARVLASPAAARLPSGFAAEAARRWWLLAERSAADA